MSLYSNNSNPYFNNTSSLYSNQSSILNFNNSSSLSSSNTSSPLSNNNSSLYSNNISTSITNLPLTDRRCNNDSCIAFEIAHNLSQETVSYARQIQHGHWVAWYYAIIILLFALIHAYHHYASRAPRTQTRTALRAARSKALAAGRYFTYRRAQGYASDRLGLPSFGILALLLLSILFVCILAFTTRPYYREHRGFGSPPLAVRAGLMAAACLPLIVALSGKANFITLLTGIGYERLNVFHRWLGWIFFGLSVVHAVPYIVAPLRDGGYAALHKQFYRPGSSEYTGIAPLAILFAISLFSIPIIRRRFYEAFYFLHVIFYVAFLGLCFWHFGEEGEGWAYLWVAVAIVVSTVIARIFWFNRSITLKKKWKIGAPVEMQAYKGGMTRLSIRSMPEEFSWRPGQHCFLRFPNIEALGNHPFTIASACVRESHVDEKDGNSNPLTFYIRSHGGFTRKLAAYAGKSPEATARAWVEGPYGGLTYAIENSYDNIILVSGGGGVTACLPWAEMLVMKHNKRISMRTTAVKFIWVVRAAEYLRWITDDLQELKRIAGERNEFFEIQLFVTNHLLEEDTNELWDSVPTPDSPTGFNARDSRIPTPGSPMGSNARNSRLLTPDSPMEFNARNSRIPTPGSPMGFNHRNSSTDNLIGATRRKHPEYETGRPHVKDLLPNLIAPNGKTFVIGCGPQSLKTDLSNVCAKLQTSVLIGKADEIALHTETFV